MMYPYVIPVHVTEYSQYIFENYSAKLYHIAINEVVTSELGIKPANNTRSLET